MDRETNAKYHVLEHMLLDANAEPTDLPLSLLDYITNGFSDDDRRIGSGGFAVVYKGILENGMMVAVKKLSKMFDIHDDKFKEEVSCLMKAKHKNVVRFLGYCSDTRGIMAEYQGKPVMVDIGQRLLCFEYLPKGSLDEYIIGASRTLEWSNRYQIIKGVCQGLHYLHAEQRIVHLDLKPANILLDDNMVPKIADFGLSRCFDEKQSRVLTSNLKGTLGYLPPEIFSSGEITFKFDIYSLGIIIREILTGQKEYCNVESVLDIWQKRMQESKEDIQLEQVRVCAEIGIKCTETNPASRPSTQNIINRLDGTASTDWFTDTSVSSSSLGQVEKDSKRLHHCEPNKEVQGETNTVSPPLISTTSTYGAVVSARTIPAASKTTLLILSGKSDEDLELLASAVTSLSLEEGGGEFSLSLAHGVGKDDEGINTAAYMDALCTRRFGRWMLWSPRITCTLDFMAQNFSKLPVGTVCVAHMQSKGRGQSKNQWKPSPGSLMFSFTSKMHDGRTIPLIQYVICVVMIEAIKELSCAKGLPELDVKIKWPNDLYVKGSKVCDFFCTSSYRLKVFNICIGVGLNVDNEKPTACLNAALQELKANSPGLKREDILASFFNKFEAMFEIFLNQGFQAFEERYYNSWLHSGQRVVVQDGNVVTIQGLTPSGYLYAEGEDGQRYELHPDGSGFDLSTLYRRKFEA